MKPVFKLFSLSDSEPIPSLNMKLGLNLKVFSLSEPTSPDYEPVFKLSNSSGPILLLHIKPVFKLLSLSGPILPLHI